MAQSKKIGALKAPQKQETNESKVSKPQEITITTSLDVEGKKTKKSLNPYQGDIEAILEIREEHRDEIALRTAEWIKSGKKGDRPKGNEIPSETDLHRIATHLGVKALQAMMKQGLPLPTE